MTVRSIGKSVVLGVWFLSAMATVASAHWVDPVRRNITDDFTHGQTAFPFDFDGDNDLDIIASYSLADRVYVLINPGDDFTPWTRHLVVTNFVATRAIPFDGDCDGTADVAATELFTRSSGFESLGRIAWYRRPSPLSGAWTEQVIESSVIHPYYIAAGDIDGDGDTDLAAVTNSTSVANSVFWYENRCGSSSGPRWQRFTVATGNAFGSAGSVQLALIDGDASLDVVVADKGNGRVVWFENGGSPRRNTWPMRTMRSDIAGPEAARPYDLDGDGDLDVIVAFRGANRVAWLEHPADPTGTWPVHDVSTSFVDPRDVAVADMNRDGRLDVIALSGDSAFGGIDTLAIFENNGNATYTRRLADGNFYSGSYVNPGDIDGDGDADLATGSYNGNSIDWWENVHESSAVNPAPVILSVTPASGPLAGGTRVAIEGSGFSAGARITFGGADGLSPTVDSTRITVTTPSRSTAGSVDVVVINSDGQATTRTNGFTYTGENSGPTRRRAVSH